MRDETMAFLTNMTDEQKRAAIENLSDARRAELVRGCWRGTNVYGLGLDEAMQRAKVESVSRVPMFIDGRDGARVKVPGHFALRGDSTGSVCTVQTATFGVLQHSEALEPLRPVLARGDATMLGLDVRDGGAKVDAFALLGFAAVQRAGIEQADGIAYMLRAGNAHDGTSAAWVALSARRLRCDNGQGFWTHSARESIKHTSRAASKLVDYGAQVHALLGIAEKSVETFQALADTPMSATEFVEFASAWLLDVKGEPADRKAEEKRVDEAADLLAVFQGTAGTRTNLGRDRYDALNAVTEWLTPRRESYRKSAERFASAYYSNESGARAGQRAKALRLLTR